MILLPKVMNTDLPILLNVINYVFMLFPFKRARNFTLIAQYWLVSRNGFERDSIRAFYTIEL